MAVARTHRPVWDQTLCMFCRGCRKQCPAMVFVEQVQEKNSLRGQLARAGFFSGSQPRNPPCQQACPLAQDVPGYLSALASFNFNLAFEIILQSNPFPSVCGSICPAPCMRACVRNTLDEPVQIRALKKASVDGVDNFSGVILENSRSVKVVVVGAGPAGLSAAFFLRREGFAVDVYEASAYPGGLLRWAVPSFDLPPELLERDLRVILNMGIELKLGQAIGNPQELDELFKQGVQAVVLATGSGKGSHLGISGENLEGCVDGIAFAKENSHRPAQQLNGPCVVAGVGVMAIAVARMALRMGAHPVQLLLERKRKIGALEPWSMRLAEEEGIQVMPGIWPEQILGGQSITTVRCQSTSDPKESVDLPASIFIAAKNRVTDLGWLHGDGYGYEVALSPQGRLVVDANNSMTSHPGVFAAGEVVSGPRSIVRAIAMGKKLAQDVSRYLLKGQS